MSILRKPRLLPKLRFLKFVPAPYLTSEMHLKSSQAEPPPLTNGGSLWIAPPRKFRLALHFAFAFRAKTDRRVAETRSAAPGFKRRVKGPNRAVKGLTAIRPGSNDRTSDRPTAIHFWGGYPYRPAIRLRKVKLAARPPIS